MELIKLKNTSKDKSLFHEMNSRLLQREVQQFRSIWTDAQRNNWKKKMNGSLLTSGTISVDFMWFFFFASEGKGKQKKKLKENNGWKFSKLTKTINTNLRSSMKSKWDKPLWPWGHKFSYATESIYCERKNGSVQHLSWKLHSTKCGWGRTTAGTCMPC